MGRVQINTVIPSILATCADWPLSITPRFTVSTIGAGGNGTVPLLLRLFCWPRLFHSYQGNKEETIQDHNFKVFERYDAAIRALLWNEYI